jgi:hypothetical protein
MRAWTDILHRGVWFISLPTSGLHAHQADEQEQKQFLYVLLMKKCSLFRYLLAKKGSPAYCSADARTATHFRSAGRP